VERLLLKLVAHAILLTALLVVLSNATMGYALLTALGIGIVSYYVGDLGILPRTNNIFATACDAVLVLLTVWIVSAFANWTMSPADILTVAVLAGGFEYFYHMWLLRYAIRRQRA
jgi:hypothetical protein